VPWELGLGRVHAVAHRLPGVRITYQKSPSQSPERCLSNSSQSQGNGYSHLSGGPGLASLHSPLSVNRSATVNPAVPPPTTM
jgi:hypothetical protein